MSNLAEGNKPDEALIDRAKELDKHYIPTRYPIGFERGAPVDFYTEREARYAPRSDLDVFVLLSQSGKDVRDRVPVYLPGEGMEIAEVEATVSQPIR